MMFFLGLSFGACVGGAALLEHYAYLRRHGALLRDPAGRMRKPLSHEF
jgi:hypothetical protein